MSLLPWFVREIGEEHFLKGNFDEATSTRASNRCYILAVTHIRLRALALAAGRATLPALPTVSRRNWKHSVLQTCWHCPKPAPAAVASASRLTGMGLEEQQCNQSKPLWWLHQPHRRESESDDCDHIWAADQL